METRDELRILKHSRDRLDGQRFRRIGQTQI